CYFPTRRSSDLDHGCFCNLDIRLDAVVPNRYGFLLRFYLGHIFHHGWTCRHWDQDILGPGLSTLARALGSPHWANADDLRGLRDRYPDDCAVCRVLRLSLL